MISNAQLTNVRSSIDIEKEKKILADEVLSLIQKSQNMEQWGNCTREEYAIFYV